MLRHLIGVLEIETALRIGIHAGVFHTDLPPNSYSLINYIRLLHQGLEALDPANLNRAKALLNHEKVVSAHNLSTSYQGFDAMFRNF